MSPLKFTLSAAGLLKISNMADGDPANDYAFGLYFEMPEF
jgi:hypothetical protein